MFRLFIALKFSYSFVNMVEREIDQYIKKRILLYYLYKILKSVVKMPLFTVSWKINHKLINVQIGLSIMKHEERILCSC